MAQHTSLMKAANSKMIDTPDRQVTVYPLTVRGPVPTGLSINVIHPFSADSPAEDYSAVWSGQRRWCE